MKHLVLIILAALSVAAYAQSEHLTFKGVPIDGTLAEYTEKMQEKGFHYLYSEKGLTILQGDFAGYKNCQIGVSTLDNMDLVSTIAVIFTTYDSWGNLYSNYANLKEMLSEKYGTPSIVVEEFQSSYPPRDDQSRMREVFMDRCKYFSVFETDLGAIELSINKAEDYMEGMVVLRYQDKINSTETRAAAMDDL